MSRKFAIAGVQMFVHENNIEQNLKSMENSVSFIAHSYPFVDMILFSELCVYGAPFPAWKRKATEIPGELIDRLCELAKKHGKWLVPGSFYEKSGSDVFNTAVAISPAGKIEAKYRKLFPWQPLEQTTPGSEFCVFDVNGVGKFGLCICYDMWFPEVCRTLAWMGAEVILHPTMTASTDREQELIIARANAIFNQFYFIDINGAGYGGNGRSLMVDPNGRVLQSCGNEPAIMVEVIDLDEVKTTRQYGTAGVSQALKQFKAFRYDFPVYSKGIANGPGFKDLGEVALQKAKAKK